MLQYTLFITGANRGLGLELVRQYAAENWRVYASCRDLVRAKALQSLAQHFSNITLLQLDTTNAIQLNQIANKYANINIDILINNAKTHPTDSLHTVSVADMNHAFLTNAVAPLKVSQTLLENIARSHLKTIVTVGNDILRTSSSKRSDKAYSYPTSMAALNTIMKNLASDGYVQKRGIKVFAINPTEGNHYKNVSIEQNATNIRYLLFKLTHNDSGKIYNIQKNKESFTVKTA